jgi:ATP phosphoribosyltransferase regulatory subunit
VLEALSRHDFVELERRVAALDLTPERRDTLAALPQLRGGPEVIERAIALGGDDVRTPLSRLAEVADRLAQRGVAERVIFDLGLVRDLGYYTGAIFEVYDPALGHVIGGGGRYDGLLARFGSPLPACGFALYVERMHVAQAEEDRLRAEAAR